jgi:hypothetical protein
MSAGFLLPDSQHSSRFDDAFPHVLSEGVHHELGPLFRGDRKSLRGTPRQQCFHVHLDFDGTYPLRLKVLNLLFPFHERLFVRGVKRRFVF